MLGYGALASCARACHHAPSTTTSAKVPNAIVLTIFRFIDSSGDTDLSNGYSRPSYGEFTHSLKRKCGLTDGYGVFSTTETVSFRGIFDVEPFEFPRLSPFELRGW